VSGNERKRECRECFFFFFLFSFFLREIKKRCVCESGDGKELEKCRESFSVFDHDRVCIYIHNLQCQCNLSLNCNEQYKEGIGHDSANYEYQIAAN